MRHVLLSAVALGVLPATLLPQSATARAKARSSCAAKNSKTVKSTKAVRIYRKGENLFGCARRTGRDVSLYKAPAEDQTYEVGGFSDVKVRGTVVAWRTSFSEVSCSKFDLCPPGGPSRIETVESEDVGTTRITERELTFDSAPSSYAVTSTGLLVAVVGTTVYGSDGSGQRVLETGTGPAGTLRAEITTVSWFRDGVERFARLR